MPSRCRGRRRSPARGGRRGGRRGFWSVQSPSEFSIPPLKGEGGCERERAAGWVSLRRRKATPPGSLRSPPSPQAGRDKKSSLRRLRVGHVTAAVAAHAHIGLFSMRDEALEHAEPRAHFADLG